MNHPINDHTMWFADVRRILNVIEATPGLPLPQISAGLVAFHYTCITCAEVAREAVTCAEAALSDALGIAFKDKDTPRIGSMEHYVREALMPSGLRVDIVAQARHMEPARSAA